VPATEWPWLLAAGVPVPTVVLGVAAPAIAPGIAPVGPPAVPTVVPAPPLTDMGVTCMRPTDPAFAAEVAQRAPQEVLFTPAVRRDLYAIFLNPGAPGTAAGAAAPTFGIALLGKPSVAGGALDTFAYVDRAAAETYTAGHLGFTLFDDKVLLDSLQQIGTTSPAGLAATIALEAYLAATAKASWSTDTVRSLSVEFLTAFGVEMTPRLDVNHRVRATKLSPDDVRTLSTPPFNAFVDQSTLRTFQAMP